MILHMRVDNESSKGIILLFVDFILNNSKNVKSGKNRVCKVYIIIEVESSIVGSFNRVSCSYHTAPSLERGDNTSL